MAVCTARFLQGPLAVCALQGVLWSLPSKAISPSILNWNICEESLFVPAAELMLNAVSEVQGATKDSKERSVKMSLIEADSYARSNGYSGVEVMVKDAKVTGVALVGSVVSVLTGTADSLRLCKYSRAGLGSLRVSKSAGLSEPDSGSCPMQGVWEIARR